MKSGMDKNQFTTVIVQGKDEIAHIKAVKTLIKKGLPRFSRPLALSYYPFCMVSFLVGR
jgi:hypothetical protein